MNPCRCPWPTNADDIARRQPLRLLYGKTQRAGWDIGIGNGENGRRVFFRNPQPFAFDGHGGMRRLRHLAVAGIVGIETVQQARVLGVTDGLATVALGTAQVIALADDLSSGAQDVYACIRAEDVVLARDGTIHSSSRNRLPAVVRSVQREGPLERVELDCGFPLLALLTPQSCEQLALREGSRVLALIKAPQIHLIARATDVRD